MAGRQDEEWVLTLPAGGRPIKLRRADGSSVLFVASQRFVVVVDDRYEGEFKTSTREYIYKIWRENDASDSPAVEWHWHPARGTSDPHLHARPLTDGVWGEAWDKHHLPTGRIAFEQIVLFLIKDLEVVPAAADWEERLSDALAAFERWRTWPAAIPVAAAPSDAGLRPKRTRAARRRK